MAVDVGQREVGQRLPHTGGCKRLDLLLKATELVVVGLLGAHDGDELGRLIVVGNGCGDEVLAHEVKADGRLRMVGDELRRILLDLGR